MKPGTPDDLARSLSAMRREYAGALSEEDLAADWPTQFGRWFADATEFADATGAALPEPNAMILATADAAGRPSARTVLLKAYDTRGFVWYTNHGSRKGRDLADNPHASLVFPWYPLHRQVVVTGPVARVDRAETEAYFAVRPRGAQVGAWASRQSSVLPSRDALVAAVAEAQARLPAEVPAPPHWGGYRLAPDTVEFWQGRPDRLHDRLRFRRTDGGWVIERLSP